MTTLEELLLKTDGEIMIYIQHLSVKKLKQDIQELINKLK